MAQFARWAMRGGTAMALWLGAACGARTNDPCDIGGCGACAADTDCPAGAHCSSDTCLAECASGGPNCADGQTCNERGRCVATQADPQTLNEGGILQADPASVRELQDAACAEWTARAEYEPATVMFVADISGSMGWKAQNTDGETKWDVTRDALLETLRSLSPNTAVGWLFYPNRGTGSSTVQLPIDQCIATAALIEPDLLGVSGSAHRQRLSNLIRLVEPQGGTPTQDAVEFALGPLERAPFGQSKHLVLLTDGLPTYSRGCQGSGSAENQVDTSSIIEAFGAASSRGVRSFIVGSPGSERVITDNPDPNATAPNARDDARPWLSLAAEAGGTSRGNGCSHSGPPYCHFDMVDAPDLATALREALDEIARTAISCTYRIPDLDLIESLQQDKVTLVFTDGTGKQSLLLRDEAEDCTEGWRLLPDGPRVELCTDSCRRVRADINASLQLLFEC